LIGGAKVIRLSGGKKPNFDCPRNPATVGQKTNIELYFFPNQHDKNNEL